MPIKKSAKKALRQNKKRAIYNKKIKDSIDYLSRKAKKLIDKGDKDKAKDFVAKAIKAIDKAAIKGVIKKNTHNRKKSILQKRLNALLKK